MRLNHKNSNQNLIESASTDQQNATHKPFLIREYYNKLASFK